MNNVKRSKRGQLLPGRDSPGHHRGVYRISERLQAFVVSEYCVIMLSFSCTSSVDFE